MTLYKTSHIVKILDLNANKITVFFETYFKNGLIDRKFVTKHSKNPKAEQIFWLKKRNPNVL